MFYVGQRVIGKHIAGHLHNKCGRIVKIANNIAYVEWDENCMGHDCDGLAKDGHGWNIKFDYIIPLEINKEESIKLLVNKQISSEQYENIK